MEENKQLLDKSLLAKQNEIINICYDRLLDVLRETTNEATIIKCIEIIRKDMAAAIAPAGSKQSAINDTYQRVAEIEKQLKKL
ncbi:MAG: hypothetical protein IJE18_02060 [Bacteroidaceae bacterium]|nr:hypothetical protein [Bacteroidales bacterium]MBP3671193.1 hypothetical protein [Bacteroidaceae bacterium]MBQ2978880.1 hypothetical protein [Bacteroidaceae bacterium]